jgi:cobalt-zinc-cadmium efflux system outer membrane protein
MDAMSWISQKKWLAAPMALAAGLAGMIGCQSTSALKSASTDPVELQAPPENVTLLTNPELTTDSATPYSGATPVVYQESNEDLSTILPAEDIPLPQPSLDDVLTLMQLEQMAMANNPSLAEAGARVEALRGKWVQVGLPPNTVLGYSGQQLGSGGQAEQQGLFVGQEFVRGGKLRLNRAVAAREIQKAEQLWAAQQMRVATDVRLAYYEVLVAQRRNLTTSQLVGIAQQAIETAEALHKAKEVSQVDVIRARIELQSAQLSLKNAKNLYTAAWSRLVSVLGVHDMKPRPLAGDIERTGGEIDADEALARLIGESPEMAAALSEVERARWAVDRANAEPVPNIDVQAIVQSDNGTNSSNANLQVSIPIPWLNRNQGGILQAQAKVIAAERAIDRLALSFKHRLAGVYQRYANARNQVEEYSKAGGILANSKSSLDFIRIGYQAGEINYLDLITAQRTYSQTHLAYIESLGELWAAVVEIDGLLLKGSLQHGGGPMQ